MKDRKDLVDMETGIDLPKIISTILKELVTSAEHEQAIKIGLKRVVELVNVDRSYIFMTQSRDDDLVATMLYEAVKDGVSTQIGNPELNQISMRSAGFSRWIDLFQEGAIIEGDVDTFPLSEQEVLKAQQIVAIVCIPLFLENQLWGFFGIDFCNNGIILNKQDRLLLEILSNTLAAKIDALNQENILNNERSRNKNLSTLVENIPTEIHVFDIKTMHYIYMNKIASKRLGYSEEEYSKLTPKDIVHGLNPEEIELALVPLLQDDTEQIFVKSFHKTKSGEIYPVETRLARLEYEGGSYFIAMADEITTLVNIEDELNSQRQMFEDLFRNSIDAGMIFTKDECLDVNIAMVKEFGYSREELLRMKLSEFSPAHQPEGIKSTNYLHKNIIKCIRHGSCQFEWQALHKKGYTFWVDILLTRLSHGKKLLIHAMIRDITQRKKDENLIVAQQNQLAHTYNMINQRYEEERHLRYQLEDFKLELEKRVEEEVEKNREKDRMLHNQSKSVQMGEMLSMIAHQWRQPLNAISASAISVAMQQSLGELTPEKIMEHSKFIQNETQIMSRTINDFMNFFKPEQKRDYFSFDELMSDTCSLLGAQLESRGIKLRYDENCECGMYGYKKELTHVIINLIANSRDAYELQTNKEKFIDINYKFEDVVKIIVQDYAGGIEEESLDKIFNPYFTTKEQGKGTGIGLYMSKRIIKEVFKGSINVEHTGEGLKFTLLLPIEK